MNYRIEGDTLPVVIMNLEAGESIITEGGGMSWMSPNMCLICNVCNSVKHDFIFFNV